MDVELEKRGSSDGEEISRKRPRVDNDTEVVDNQDDKRWMGEILEVMERDPNLSAELIHRMSSPRHCLHILTNILRSLL